MNIFKTFKNSISFGTSYYWMVPVSWILLVAHTSNSIGTAYSPDSYAYFVIGHNLLSGFGFTSQAIRDFYLPLPFELYQPSRSFPPLTPILLGILEKLLSTKIYTGVLLNIYITLLVLHAHFFIAKKISHNYFWVIFLCLPIFLLCGNMGSEFINEIASGRTIPLQLLLLLIIVLIISRCNVSLMGSFVVGLIAGALYLNRFDAFFFSLTLLLFIIIKHLANTKLLLFGFLISTVPWFIRNFIVFNNLFASDNTITVLSTYTSVAQISWLDEIPFYFDTPFLWITQRIKYLLTNLLILANSLSIPGALISFLILVYGLRCTPLQNNQKKFISISFIWIICNVAVVSLTPYHDLRYFSISAYLLVVSTCLVFLNIIFHSNPQSSSKSITRKAIVINLSLLIFSIGFVNFYLLNESPKDDLSSSLFKCASQDFKDIIKKSDLIASSEAEKLNFYTNWRTIYLPLNMSNLNSSFISWANKMNIDFILLSNDSHMLINNNLQILKESCNLVLVSLKK